MMRVPVVSGILVLLLFCAWSAETDVEAAPPNILILLGDDIDRDSLGPWGGQAQTPHLDQLARDGMRLDNVYCNVAMCAPFRQELYSGRTVWRTRAMPNHSKSVKGTKSLPHYLKPLGYRVGLLGKRHIGPNECYPFDNVGSLSKQENANPQAVKLAREYMTTAREAGQPFCLVVASHDAHGPYTTGDPSQYDQQGLSLNADTIDTRAYRRELVQHYAEITNLDDLLGQLRTVLKEEQLTNNTLVLFCSEQGNAFPFSKWTCFDDGLATGVVVSLPGVIPEGKRNSQLMWLADIAPTLLTAAGGQPDDQDFDGRSQWANLTGGNQRVHEYAFGAFTNCNIIDNRERIFPIRSIRDQRYTLIWSPRADQEITSNTTLTQALEWLEAGNSQGRADTAGSWVRRAQKTKRQTHNKLVQRLHHRPEWALYDRQADPEELENLVDKPEMAPVLKRLKGELHTWLQRWDDADPVATERSFLKQK